MEYAEVKNDKKWEQAAINYAYKILDTDFTVIGSAGCTHELFDHSTVRQANTTNEFIMQETCVTVTLMKFFGRILKITGDSRFADAAERSFYNAYLGAENPQGFMDDRAEKMQGITTITLVVVVATGILTSVLGPTILKFLKVEDPVAIGLALGGTGHAVGTGTAFQYGQVAGAMGGLAIGITGVFYVFISPLVASLILS